MTSASLHSYSSAKEHPNLQEELDAFRGFIPEAAARTAVFYEKTRRMLKDAISAVNEAAAAKAPFRLQTLPAASYPDVPPSIRNAVGDGFELGWCIAIRPQAYLHVLNLHGYPPDWLLKQAQEAGVSFIRPYDADLFDWSVVETEPGKYDWSKIDEAASMVVQHDLGLILPLLSFSDSPSDWLRQRIGDRAVLVGPDGKPITENRRRGDAFAFSQVSAKPERTPMNMFDGEVAEAFGRYAQALVRRLRDAGVRILAVELDSTLPWCAGEQATARFRRWLAENKIDPRARWGAQFDASGAIIPEKLQTAGTADPGQKRMMIDLVCWREQEYIDYLRPQVQALREIDRGLPLCSFSSEVAEANEAMTGRNNERLIRELGLIPLGFSLENIWDNLRRAYSPSHYSIAFTHAGAGDAYSQYAMSGYAHDTLTLFSLPQVRGFIWGEQVFYYDLRWEFSSLLGWRRFHERAQGMAPEMLNTRPAPQVALLLSDTSGKFQSFISDYVGGTYGFNVGPANYNKIGCIGWGRILDSIGLSQDMLTEEQIRAGGLSACQMLVMPAVQALPADVAEKIRQFVSNGGILIATSAAAIHDENMDARMPGQLADVLGADFESFIGRATVAHSPLTSPRKDGPEGVWQPDKRYRDTAADTMQTLFCTFKPRDGAEVLEVYSGDGKPAVVRNTFGKGQAVAIGYPVGRESFLSLVYWQHYGSNWPHAPQGSVFQQGIFRWVEMLFQKVQFNNEGRVIDEECPRSSTYDAAYAEGTWPRSTQRYRDYFWYRATPPRSVELIFRRGPDNTNTYMEVFNREGAYGLHPARLSSK
ncbi:MAG TPA: beta-galactosidase trimerization domain-containing protein [Planctomycetota bacterium]|nr:beta-galactosidase trimerization domain-containing protein [Planctomycetota bacterium]